MSRRINAPSTYSDTRKSMPKCRHTPCPSGYVAWHEWAEKKSRTHEQHRCPVCDGWAIWKKRVAEGETT